MTETSDARALIGEYLLKCRSQTAEYYPEDGSIFLGVKCGES
jgi:hypothetical protein